jgi:hypothetical protein
MGFIQNHIEKIVTVYLSFFGSLVGGLIYVGNQSNSNGNSIKEIQFEMRQVNTLLAFTSSQITEMRSEMDNYNIRLNDLEAKLSSVSNTAISLESNLEEIEIDISVIEDNVSRLENLMCGCGFVGSVVEIIGPRGKSLLSGNLSPTDSVGFPGDFYIDLGLQRLYGPKLSSGWLDFITLGFQGPKGDPGDPGEMGLVGEQGLKGDTGANGICPETCNLNLDSCCGVNCSVCPIGMSCVMGRCSVKTSISASRCDEFGCYTYDEDLMTYNQCLDFCSRISDGSPGQILLLLSDNHRSFVRTILKDTLSYWSLAKFEEDVFSVNGTAINYMMPSSAPAINERCVIYQYKCCDIVLNNPLSVSCFVNYPCSCMLSNPYL